MNLKRTTLAILVLILFAGSILLFRRGEKLRPSEAVAQPKPVAEAPVPDAAASKTPLARPGRIKLDASEFSAESKAGFRADFETKYKPAIIRWCKAYEGHVPLAPDLITADNFVSVVGNSPRYHEYVFAVNGITMGVRDANGAVSVDYLNYRPQTEKMMALPDGSQAPATSIPVTADEVARMIKDDSGQEFSAHDIRVIPSGFSGSLNGGVIAEVGGDPENFISWNYNMVFGPDGVLAYYLKGHN
jgi:hypothetical protein